MREDDNRMLRTIPELKRQMLDIERDRAAHRTAEGREDPVQSLGL